MEFHTPNFAGITLLPQFQDIPLELKSARIFKYSLPFKNSLVLKHTTLTVREGLILVLTDVNGKTGMGEISPLPGFSRETLETALLNTTMLLDKMVGSGEFTAHYYSKKKGGWQDSVAPAIAHFGVETAILSLLSNSKNVGGGELIFGKSSDRVPINGLIRGSLSDWVPEAERMIRDGYKTLKIKVGRINSTLEARGIQDIRKFAGPEIKLRLDANRSWDLATAIEFGKAVEPSNIEYIEEPLQEPVDLPRFFDACGVPFAFDETLHQIMDPTISFESYTGLRALVLKPTLIACTARLISLVNQAIEKGVLPVLSSSYESDVGLTTLAQLAGSISGENIAAGLDTRSAFTAGTTKSPTAIHDGWMSTRSITTQDLDLSHCELLYQS
ncbi:MAG: o-succinylbenzoate synthase [FCB group bacterium]|nr:o-succinylbenzoate synthase [FCB group bacterium]MBL7028496.1 o-succinylbenzoate synthase [Candidatus Neomarinimicrobiota bacterium]MBL7121560.1 o-succinylbenzoate synthase [Candidatus Neomarinimicrobiota bacterium]